MLHDGEHIVIWLWLGDGILAKLRVGVCGGGLTILVRNGRRVIGMVVKWRDPCRALYQPFCDFEEVPRYQ
jgi:hypothetical protein